jgi:hypothetical protein
MQVMNCHTIHTTISRPDGTMELTLPESQRSISGINTCFPLLDHEHRVEHFCNRSLNILRFGAIGNERFTYKLQVGFQRIVRVEMSKVFQNACFSVLPTTDISMASVRLPALV